MGIPLKPWAYRIDFQHFKPTSIPTYDPKWYSLLTSTPFDAIDEENARLFLYHLISLHVYSNPNLHRKQAKDINNLYQSIRGLFAFEDNSTIQVSPIADSFKTTKIHKLLLIILHELIGLPIKIHSFHFMQSPVERIFRGDLAYAQAKAFSYTLQALSKYPGRKPYILQTIEKSEAPIVILGYKPCSDFYIDKAHFDARFSNQTTSSHSEDWLNRAYQYSIASGVQAPLYHSNSLPVLWLPTNHPKFTLGDFNAGTTNPNRHVRYVFDLKSCDIPLLEDYINNPTQYGDIHRAIASSIGNVYMDILNNPLKVKAWLDIKANEIRR
jgi:hypothetical protein